MKPVDELFLKNLQTGDRMFNYKKTAGKEKDYILYTVLKTLKNDEIILINSFDEKEEKKQISFRQIIKDKCWWFNPLFQKAK
jgi:hypothetical protein